jgi:hypothetical protein
VAAPGPRSGRRGVADRIEAQAKLVEALGTATNLETLMDVAPRQLAA